MRAIYFFIGFFLCLTQVSCIQSDRKFKIPDVSVFKESYIDSKKYLSTQSQDVYDVDFKRLFLEERNQWTGITEEEILRIGSRNGNKSDVLVLISSYYLSKGEIDKSQILCDRSKKLGASSVEYYILRSKIHAQKGQNDIAIDQINRAILVNRFDAELYREKGQLYLDFGDTLSAINYLQKSVLLDTMKLESCILIAKLYGLKNDDQKAKEWLEQGLKFDPKNVELKYVKSDLLRSNGLHVEANELLNELLQDGNSLAGEKLVEFFVANSESDSVLSYANKLLVLDTLNVAALLAKGEVFDKKGYFSSSLNYYEKVLMSDSTNQEALHGVQKVKGKIAYLRKIREQRESIPTFDFLNSTEKKTLN